MIHGSDEYGGLSIVVQRDEVKKAVKRLNSEKTVGVDGVPGQVAKLVAVQRFEELLNMFNDINRTGQIPKI
jgi:hypothetical protein